MVPELYKYKLLEFLEMNLSLDTLLKVKKILGHQRIFMMKANKEKASKN